MDENTMLRTSGWRFDSFMGYQVLGYLQQITYDWKSCGSWFESNISLREISSSGRATKRYPVVYGSVAESGLLHLSWKQTIRNGPWVRISPLPPNCRELDEWFKSLPWKGSLSVTATWVRIPHSLPVLCSCSLMVKLRAYTSAMPLDEGMIQVRILSGVPWWVGWDGLNHFPAKKEADESRSVGSNPTLTTSYAPMDKLVKSALSKGAVLSVRIGVGVPR